MKLLGVTVTELGRWLSVWDPDLKPRTHVKKPGAAVQVCNPELHSGVRRQGQETSWKLKGQLWANACLQ